MGKIFWAGLNRNIRNLSFVKANGSRSRHATVDNFFIHRIWEIFFVVGIAGRKGIHWHRKK
jgi:hypothetical protein